ncbi:hypothetical protein D6D04_01750 [Aureobasidium pullulans]|nr:hypothetical protein D6D04_01750 [Aureobasidium pullulans]
MVLRVVAGAPIYQLMQLYHAYGTFKRARHVQLLNGAGKTQCKDCPDERQHTRRHAADLA